MNKTEINSSPRSLVPSSQKTAKKPKASALDKKVYNGLGDTSLPQVARPFVKWVGGKRSILPTLKDKMISKAIVRYYEPFLGGGALFFSINHKATYLSDINFHLITAYQAIRDNVELVIKFLKVHVANHGKDYYLKMRKRLTTERNSEKIASIFIYINKTCFNGLYRVNKAGGFNVPMGSYKNPSILDEKNLINCSKYLRGVKIYQHNFMSLTPEKGSFYYLDPPYHKTYDQYSNERFRDAEHIQLSKFCMQIDKMKGYFMLSNSDTPLIRELYNLYNIETVIASRTISCKANQRGKKKELIIRNYK